MEKKMYSIGKAYLFWFLSLFGLFGFHRFYLGKIPTGILWMFTGGGFLIGTVYDFFTLGSQVREANIRGALFSSPREMKANMEWRNVTDGQARVIRPETSVNKDSLERIILKTAKENKGILTVSDVALAANVPLDQAKNYLENLVKKGIVELRVRKTGAMVYVMQDFADAGVDLEDF